MKQTRDTVAISPGLSGPVHRMFPNMTGGQQVVLIIALEHAMLLLKVVLSNLAAPQVLLTTAVQFLISAAIPDTPAAVELELARTEYRRREVERLVTTQRLQELCSNQVPGG